VHDNDMIPYIDSTQIPKYRK